MNPKTDRELLELAAKAAGLPYIKPLPEYDGSLGLEVGSDNPMRCRTWNPLTDDGDALRLAVKLGLSVEPYPIYQPEKHSVVVKQRRWSDTMREANPTEVLESYGDDPYAATRRAITRAAAEVAKAVGES